MKPRKTATKAASAIIAVAFAGCFHWVSLAKAGDWIMDAKTGCRAWNPNPVSGETVAWSGLCKNGLAEGKGVLQWLSAGKPHERDEGEWREGRQTGEGLQNWPNGEYRGQLENGMPHGRGVLTIGAARYEGAFLNGKPNGQGILKNANGVFEGTWRDGCFGDGKRKAAIGSAVQDCP
jgi:hypothetical protein